MIMLAPRNRTARTEIAYQIRQEKNGLIERQCQTFLAESHDSIFAWPLIMLRWGLFLALEPLDRFSSSASSS